MNQYCVYCTYCVQDEGNGLSCMSYDKEMTMNAAKRDNKCPNYQPSPLGHVITGKQYRPQKWRYMRVYTKQEDYMKEDCRSCENFDTCPCGKQGHEKGSSIGYSIGECKEYKEKDSLIKGYFKPEREV